MTIDEYLKACTNVPALPPGLSWWITSWKDDRDFTRKNGETYSRNFTNIEIEILDKSRTTQASYLYRVQTDVIGKYPQVINSELPVAALNAYNNLYKNITLDYSTLVSYFNG